MYWYCSLNFVLIAMWITPSDGVPVEVDDRLRGASGFLTNMCQVWVFVEESRIWHVLLLCNRIYPYELAYVWGHKFTLNILLKDTKSLLPLQKERNFSISLSTSVRAEVVIASDQRSQLITALNSVESTDFAVRQVSLPNSPRCTGRCSPTRE